MTLKLKLTPGIYLAGFMGSGKSTIGRLLAQDIGWPFVDLDERLEAREGAAISKIFAERGEAEFRRVESAVMRDIVEPVRRGIPAVVALGGGTFVDPENARYLNDHGVTIWLDCPFEVVRKRVEKSTHRPLAMDSERFAALYEARRESYARADYHIEIRGDEAAESVKAILSLPLF